MSDIDDDGIEMDDLTDVKIYTFHGNHHPGLPRDTRGSVKDSFVAKETGVSIGREFREGSLHQMAHHSPHTRRKVLEDSYTSDAESEAVVKKNSVSPYSSSMDADSQVESESVVKRQRIFKVVFVGDSGVGKSSFIHRFCNNHFRASFAATIGVDFQVKALPVGDNMVVLQLWDTAGQERYRSVTKQYFRKADGVIVMYDITSERSFLNVRDWMFSVQEGVEEGTVIAIVGNKTDVVEADPEHVTKVKDGSKMAVEYNALFYETSAKSGSYINETMLGIASLLKDKEDKAMEAALTLTDAPQKKGCCS